MAGSSYNVAVMTAGGKIHLVQGDITEMNVDAIVNAANNDLLLGAGVAGAIRRKGGEAIQQECDRIGTIPIGTAAITGGGKLKARWVIHAASMELGGGTTAASLRGSTAHSLHLARQKGLKSIAFPAIGAGIGGFPVRECAEIMLGEVAEHFRKPSTLEKVYFVLFDAATYQVFVTVWNHMKSGLGE
ncbi:MAG TPA: macro domain-containing protein [Candidatus Acidoferrales bacterium]|nr:macro domain-containing protein [Candidatus Acidoferrales bacterium]